MPTQVPGAGRTTEVRIDRRRLLAGLAGGFGSVGLLALLSESAAAETPALRTGTPHHPPRAKRVIFCFMNGGPSQIDTFDPKPELARWDGQRLPVLDQN